MDVLVSRLRSASFGCKILDTYYGCLLYADDIVLLAHTLNGMQQMLNICTEFGIEYDVKFNDTKSVAMRIGPRCSAVCMPLVLAGKCLKFVDSVNYLGVCITAGRQLKCCFESVKLKFFRVFNCIYAKSKASGSEINTVQLLKSYCLPYITYACEALPFTKSDIRRLDNLVNRSLCKIFNVNSRENIGNLRKFLDLPGLDDIILIRRRRFIDKLIGLGHFEPLLRSITISR